MDCQGIFAFFRRYIQRLFFMDGLRWHDCYFERQGALAGAVLLGLYYLAHPAFPGLDQGITEGNYWLINKNIIEGLALLVIYQFPTSEYFGLKRLFSRRGQEKVVNA